MSDVTRPLGASPTVPLSVPLSVPRYGVAPTQPFEAPRRQYDLELRPGETIDLPTGLDGGRRKKVLGWLVMLAILGGMAALIVSALASQR